MVANGLRLLGATTLASVMAPAVAHAQQETVLIDQSLQVDYDRGRNVSVLDRSRPEYDPIGIRRGAFLIFPRVAVGVGVSDNVYLTDVARQGDVYAYVNPSISASSDWSRHQLSLAGGGAFRRYADESPRNQDEWFLNALGRADIGSNFAVTAEAQAARVQESPFSGAIQTNIAALSSYERVTGAVRAQYTMDRTRVTLAYDLSNFDFDEVTFTSGARTSQADRDRTVHRITVQGERAISPSLSLYGQVGYGTTDYDRTLLTGQPNRDSRALRVIAGVHFDLSAFMRGSVGVGYLRRNYRAGIYADVSGPSVEARIEYFPTELTTVTFNARRVLDDSNIGSISAFFDNQVALRVDHELRYNVLVNASALYSRQDYIGTTQNSDIYRLSTGMRYLLSPSLHLTASAAYSGRTQDQLLSLGRVREVSAEIGIVLQR